MDFEWDPDKNAANIQKHGIDFADAVSVLYDEIALTIEDDIDEEEQRFVTIGIDAYARALVVVHCVRDKKIRMISARKATKKDMKYYGEVR